MAQRCERSRNSRRSSWPIGNALPRKLAVVQVKVGVARRVLKNITLKRRLVAQGDQGDLGDHIEPLGSIISPLLGMSSLTGLMEAELTENSVGTQFELTF